MFINFICDLNNFFFFYQYLYSKYYGETPDYSQANDALKKTVNLSDPGEKIEINNINSKEAYSANNRDEKIITNKEVMNVHNFKRGYDLNHNSQDDLMEGKNDSEYKYREMVDKSKKNIGNKNENNFDNVKKEKENNKLT